MVLLSGLVLTACNSGGPLYVQPKNEGKDVMYFHGMLVSGSPLITRAGFISSDDVYGTNLFAKVYRFYVEHMEDSINGPLIPPYSNKGLEVGGVKR